jgi:ribonuclease HI
VAQVKKPQSEILESQRENGPILIFTDGAGARIDGKGSGYAFLRTDTNEKQVLSEDGLTNNQAEYKGVILALQSVDEGMLLEIRNDSQVVCEQLSRRYKVRDAKLYSLWASVQEIIQRKNLKVTFTWVSRQENQAGKLL